MKEKVVPLGPRPPRRDPHSDLAFLPPDFLENLPISRGNLRRFLEEQMFPPQGLNQQKEAGHASAREAMRALADYYDMDIDEFVRGLETVGGAANAAGGDNVLNEPDPDIPQEQQVAAFFDVDNTLIQGASIILFARGLAKRHYFTAGDVLGFLWKQAKFRLGGTESAGDMASGRDQALAFVKGRSAKEIEQIAQEIFDNLISDKVWPGTKQLAQRHLQQGHQVWLVTATPVQLAQIIAKELGFTGALGTVAEIDDDGNFTGALVGDILHGLGKRHAVAALAAYEGLDLSQCTAYSDSANDLPMLSMVGRAVAVNPDRQLRSIAKSNGWEVKDFRTIRRTASAAAPFVLAAVVGQIAWHLGKQHLNRWR